MTPLTRKVTPEKELADWERGRLGRFVQAGRPCPEAIPEGGLMQLGMVPPSISHTSAKGYKEKVVRCSLDSFKP